MRHLWLVFAIGCGSSGSNGEPLGDGTITMTYGGVETTLAVGAAVADPDSPAKMLVQLATNSIDCSSNLVASTDTVPAGSYIYFTVDNKPAMTNPAITVMRLSGNRASSDSRYGVVEITGVDERITGSVVFAATDSAGFEILIAGTFDVLRCGGDPM